ncbi:MAG: XdhC family protein [Ruminococcaceae bacterium]|nr:XdhC family protein [Oscillospiraceae bacterium]
MDQLFKTLGGLLERGQDAVLVSIVASSGSTPRGSGARMLVAGAGRLSGTIGGGAVEYKAEALAKEALAERRSYTKAFTLRRNEVEDLGMICGGDVKVYFQYIPAGPAAAAFAAQAIACFGRDEDAWLVTDITDDGGWTMALHTAGARLAALDADGKTDLPPLPENQLAGLLLPAPVRLPLGAHLLYAEPLVQAGRAVLFGGGHISQELLPLLAHLGFNCVVFDDRPDFVTEALFPAAQARILGDFEDIDRNITLTPNDYVIIMTRGHAGDYSVQRQALRQPHAYVGVIGSRSKIASVSKRLLEAGVSQAAIDAVYTPIGLSIGAKSPAEIAISIAAQLIQVRAARRAGPKTP